MSIYEGYYNQQVYSCNIIISYVREYICFTKMPKIINNSNNILSERYIKNYYID